MNEEMRKEFEAEYSTAMRMIAFVPDNLFHIDNQGDYLDADVHTAWYWWQASREAMKPIKLPKSKYIYHMSQHEMTAMIDLSECKEAIKQSGYKVE